ncbi:MAG: hypothetical protein K8R21_14350 [Leptospira sp.]|nr:hypothetical protein [Leptospira sp.]
MAIVQKVPRKLEEVLGPDGTDQFVDFINVSFNAQKEDMVQLVADKFEKKLVEEISTVKIEIANLRTELANVKSELKTDIVKVHEAITSQTKWIFGALLGAVGLFPFAWKIAERLFR